MAIKDLEVKQGKVDIVVEIVEIGDIREFSKFGTTGRVCNTKVKDETGDIALTIWNDDIEKAKVGDKVHIVNGYVNEWQGEKQLTAGRFGKIEFLGSGDAAEETAKEEPNEEAAPESSDDDKGEQVDSTDDVVEEEVLDEKK